MHAGGKFAQFTLSKLYGHILNQMVQGPCAHMRLIIVNIIVTPNEDTLQRSKFNFLALTSVAFKRQ